MDRMYSDPRQGINRPKSFASSRPFRFEPMHPVNPQRPIGQQDTAAFEISRHQAESETAGSSPERKLRHETERAQARALRARAKEAQYEAAGSRNETPIGDALGPPPERTLRRKLTIDQTVRRREEEIRAKEAHREFLYKVQVSSQ